LGIKFTCRGLIYQARKISGSDKSDPYKKLFQIKLSQFQVNFQFRETGVVLLTYLVQMIDFSKTL